MDLQVLRIFLIETKKAGYGAGNSKAWIKEKDGSTTIPFESGDWRMHDNFFGGEPWGGREVVFFKGKPVWMMVMYGSVDLKLNDFETVYKFLQKALRSQPEDLPLRGPKLLQEGEFVYKNKTEGSLEEFFGKEEICKGKNLIYKMRYSGGWVDQRKE